jgi:hypothetical protein
MKFRNAPLSALLAVALVSTPVAASAVAVDGVRGGAPVAGEQLSGGFAPAWLVAAILVVVLGIVVFSGDDDERPVSP